MKLLIILFTLLLAIVYALSRVSKSATVRKTARVIIRIAGYALAALSVLMVVLSFSNESGTFTLLLVAAAPAFASWFTFRLYERSLALDQG
ncbi:MAG: hypothetical protein ACAH80_14380 [Alphaproteobacteria bacterium]